MSYREVEIKRSTLEKLEVFKLQFMCMFIESIDPCKLRPEMLLAFSALESQGFPGGLGKRRGEGC